MHDMPIKIDVIGNGRLHGRFQYKTPPLSLPRVLEIARISIPVKGLNDIA